MTQKESLTLGFKNRTIWTFFAPLRLGAKIFFKFLETLDF
jgi:hypothetical protein